MNTPQEYSQRIQMVASARKVPLDDLKSRVDINGYRMDMLWNGKTRPEASEETKLANALGVHEAVLQSEGAKKLWMRLKEITQEGLFPELWPKLALQTGQRASDSIGMLDALIDALILGNPRPRYGIQITLIPIDATAE